MQRYFAKSKDNDFFELEKEDYHHIKHVMRFQKGEQIQVVYQKQAYLCVIESLEEPIQIKQLSLCDAFDSREKELILLLPLLKEQKMDFVLQKATELGVSKIIPVITERSIVKLSKDKMDKKIERWTRICKEASEQSYRTTIPEITKISTYQDLPSFDGLQLVCSTKERQKTLRQALQKIADYDRIVIAIGPEGGLSEKEEQRLVEQGFISVSLGKRILRVETVPIMLLSILNYEIMG